MTPTRRRFLQALGLTTGSLFLPSRGLASTATPNTRLLIFVTGHGTVYDNWRMRPTGEPDDQDWVFSGLSGLTEQEWSPILRPLRHHANKLLILDGLAHCPSIVTATNEHDEGHATCLTGHLPVLVDGSIAISSGPSIDQLLGASRTTPFRSLEYVLRGGWSPCFDLQGQRIPMESEPREAWLRLGFDAVGNNGPATTTAERVSRRQASMLDAAGSRFEWLAPRLSTADRQKLETHRDLLRDLEVQLQSTAGLACSTPGEPDHGNYWYDPAAGMTAFSQLSAAAMSCGLTDIVTLRFGDIDNGTIGAPPGDLHNDYAHNTHVDANAAAVMTDYHTWYAARFAELLDLLDSIPEGNGTMLDNTIVLWTNELSTGNHHHTDLPIVIAGGTNHFATDRIVRWAPTWGVQGPWSVPVAGAPHNKLLVSLAQAMGDCTINQVGVSSVGLAGGGVLDCTGPLDRLTV